MACMLSVYPSRVGNLTFLFNCILLVGVRSSIKGDLGEVVTNIKGNSVFGPKFLKS